MLLEDFLKPMSITQRDLAISIHVSYQRVNEIINGKRGITPSTALRLAKYFGLSEDFWMNMQLRYDLSKTRFSEKKMLAIMNPIFVFRRICFLIVEEREIDILHH